MKLVLSLKDDHEAVLTSHEIPMVACSTPCLGRLHLDVDHSWLQGWPVYTYTVKPCEHVLKASPILPGGGA